MKKGYMQGDMKPEVKDWQKPESCYAESYGQSPTDYVERQNKQQMKAGSKLKSMHHKGRY